MKTLTRRAFLAGATGCVATVARPVPGFPQVREYRRGGMIYRRLGRTDLDVSLLSFGSHTDPTYKRRVPHGYVLDEEGQKQRDRLIARALDRGVNLVDTYETEGQWEPMARLVRGRRDKVLVSICRQLPMFVGDNIDRAARLFGHTDLYRIGIGEGPDVSSAVVADWDVLRKAKEAGKVRAIGISTHDERVMLGCLRELEGLDYVMFPYNFIHARADYAEFLPAAVAAGVGLIAIKPLAAGSIVRLDPKARPGTRPENEKIQLYQSKYRPLLPAAVTALTQSLDRLPDETLCQAALRFVYSRPFLACALPGMFEEYTLDENYAALERHQERSREERAALDAARGAAWACGSAWLPPHYRWLDARWRVDRCSV